MYYEAPVRSQNPRKSEVYRPTDARRWTWKYNPHNFRASYFPYSKIFVYIYKSHTFSSRRDFTLLHHCGLNKNDPRGGSYELDHYDESSIRTSDESSEWNNAGCSRPFVKNYMINVSTSRWRSTFTYQLSRKKKTILNTKSISMKKKKIYLEEKSNPRRAYVSRRLDRRPKISETSVTGGNNWSRRSYELLDVLNFCWIIEVFRWGTDSGVGIASPVGRTPVGFGFAADFCLAIW